VTLSIGQWTTLFSDERKDLKFQLKKDAKDGSYKIIDFEQNDLWEVKLGGHASYSLTAVDKYREFVGEGGPEKLWIVTMENNRMINRLLTEKSGHEEVMIYPIDKMLPYCMYQAGKYVFTHKKLP